MKIILNIAILVFIAGASIAGYRFFSASEKPQYEFFTVSRMSITQGVTLTGKTQSLQSVDLSFETGGKVKTINKDVGDTVLVGDSLVLLDGTEQSLELNEAQASLDVELSALRELKKGARPEEVLVYETKLSNARVDLSSSASALADKLRDSFTKTDDAIRNNIDQLFSNPRSNNPQINISVPDSQLKTNIEQGRISTEAILSSLRDVTGNISPENTKVLFGQSTDVVVSLTTLKKFLDNVALAVNALSSSSSLSQSTVDAYKAAVSSARTTVNTSISAILTAEEKTKASLSAVSLSEKELALKKAGATSEQISSQEAKIRQSQARIARLRVLLEKMTLKAPIAGVVTKQDAKIGAVMSPQVVVASIISDTGLEIEAYIPEVDIGRIALGNTVKITVDAFTGESFDGTVSYIDPAETIIDGVVNFKSKIQFARNDPRLKSGLTVNLDIQTARKDNVLVVPQLAVLENDRGAFVQKLVNNNLVEIPIVLGARDRSGVVEVLSGLVEGDKVINVGLKK
ncbi:MAG: hypothetical protein RJA61_667 [Candidatus Parcubacteria bacterium]|jgi:RND family efflux transporter MFP subunit